MARRLRRGDRREPDPDQRPQPSRRRGDGHLRRWTQRRCDRLGVDADGDLAVLEAPTEGAPTLEFARARPPASAAPVVALGNPNGHGPRVTFGFVSGTGRSFRGPRGRRVAGAVEHTAPLMPGLVRRTDRRPRRTAARHQHQPPRQRLLPGDRRRCRAARPGRRARSRRVADPPPAGRRAGPVARRAPAAPRGRPAGARRTARARGRGRTPPPPRPGSPRVTSSWRSAARRSRAADDLFDALGGRAAPSRSPWCAAPTS